MIRFYVFLFSRFIGDPMAPLSADRLLSWVETSLPGLQCAQLKENIYKFPLLNFVDLDGNSLLEVRCNTDINNAHAITTFLYYTTSNSFRSDGSVTGLHARVHVERKHILATISSEPLTQRWFDWVSVLRGSSIVLNRTMHVVLSPIRRGAQKDMTTQFRIS